ncbi:16906_t:CDS:2, partial [Cetraspora pellucida]
YLKEIKLFMKQSKQNNVALPILNKNKSDNVFVVDNDSDNEPKVNEKNEQIINKNTIDITISNNNIEQIIYNTDHPAINNDAK